MGIDLGWESSRHSGTRALAAAAPASLATRRKGDGRNRRSRSRARCSIRATLALCLSCALACVRCVMPLSWPLALSLSRSLALSLALSWSRHSKCPRCYCCYLPLLLLHARSLSCMRSRARAGGGKQQALPPHRRRRRMWEMDIKREGKGGKEILSCCAGCAAAPSAVCLSRATTDAKGIHFRLRGLSLGSLGLSALSYRS